MEPSNLPAQPTPFVGRLEELHQISALINDPDCRLLTLVGPGGIGKTRLAIEAVRQLNGSKRSYFIPLQPLNSPDLIIPALAEAIGFEFNAGTEPKEQLLDYLSRNSLMLVLDNFEHLLDAAHIVSDILSAAPSIKLLVTSRERLNLVEEWSFEVQGLNFPTSASAAAVLETYSAVQLFVQRARRSQSDFTLTDARKPAVIRICRLVGGMPLGIELAAVWVRALSCDEIADEIEHSLDILTTPARNVEPRHRAMRAVLEHSWKLLTDAEQQVFQKLSVFRAGFRKDAAQVVAGASLPTLSALVDKSLLRVSESGRYEIHELLRQYGEEQLDFSGETDNTRDAHAAYFMVFLARREQDVKGRRQVAALHEIDADFENIRAAWRWHLARKNYAALDSALETFCLYWEMRGRYVDANELLWSAHDQLTAEPAAPAANLHAIKERMRVRLIWPSLFAGFSLESIAAVKPAAEEMLATARQQGDQAHIGYCLWLLGVLDVFADNYEAAFPSLEECLAVYTELDDPFYIARAADWLGGLMDGYGQREAGVKLSQQSYDLRRTIGDHYGMSAALANLIDAALGAGQYDQAKRFAQEMGQHYQALGSSKWMTRAAGYLSVATFQQGDFQETRALAEESLEIIATGGLVGRGGMAFSFAMLGMLAALEEDYARCRELCERAIGDYRDVIPLHAEGLAVAACGLGDYPTAQHYFVTALTPAIVTHDYRGMTTTLPVAAVLLAHEGHSEHAVEILGLAFHHPASAKIWMEQWPLLKRLRAQLEAELGAAVYAAAWERGKESDIETLASALMSHFRSVDSPEHAAVLAGSMSESALLTAREIEILGLMAQGMTNRDIADKLYLSIGTVKWYGSQICSKLHVHNRVQAVVRARELNLLS